MMILPSELAVRALMVWDVPLRFRVAVSFVASSGLSVMPPLAAKVRVEPDVMVWATFAVNWVGLSMLAMRPTTVPPTLNCCPTDNPVVDDTGIVVEAVTPAVVAGVAAPKVGTALLVVNFRVPRSTSTAVMLWLKLEVAPFVPRVKVPPPVTSKRKPKAVLVVKLPLTTVSPGPSMIQARLPVISVLVTPPAKVTVLPAGRLLLVVTLLAAARRFSGWVKVRL